VRHFTKVQSSLEKMGSKILEMVQAAGKDMDLEEPSNFGLETVNERETPPTLVHV